MTFPLAPGLPNGPSTPWDKTDDGARRGSGSTVPGPLPQPSRRLRQETQTAGSRCGGGRTVRSVDRLHRTLQGLHHAVPDIAPVTTQVLVSRVLEGLRRLGAFGMKIPKEHGGLGFTNAEYNRVMALIGSHCGNIAALLSAHQSIGVPQPVKLFGTEELKQKYLPRCAAGEISAFALTETDVGSDPARLATTATRTPKM